MKHVMETDKHETWYGNMSMMETWKHGSMEHQTYKTWKHGSMSMSMKHGNIMRLMKHET
jgi:hypothetical protein